MAPDLIRIRRIGVIDIVIQDHPVLDRTLSSRAEFSSRMSFSEDRNMDYKGKEKELLKVLTPQEIRVDNVKLRCPERWKEIQVIFDITKNENFFPCDDLYHLQQSIVGRYEGILEITDHEILVTGQENGSMTLGLSFLEDHKPWGRKAIASTRNLRKRLKTSRKEGKLSLENVKRLIQRNFSENPLAWWDRNKIEATLKVKEEFSAYSSPGFLVRNHGKIKRGILIDETGTELQDHIVEKIHNFSNVLKDKKHLESFLGVVNFAGIFIKNLAKYRKDFRPLLQEIESSKWKWEEIHIERVRELKQVCSNLPKLTIPQDENELVVYTDANNYRWASVLMKRTTTAEEPSKYIGGLFSEQQTQVWPSTRKNSLQSGRLLRNDLCFYLIKNSH
ncbi:UNVERIFIED_CONTAM: Polyprotein P3 [Sesamum calycinum]|uniref:Polyprotein P3 n=1 Tax=Sesamum calycinum TaxID=2727403 RepID=A0AAW2LSN0_9LAMI